MQPPNKFEKTVPTDVKKDDIAQRNESKRVEVPKRPTNEDHEDDVDTKGGLREETFSNKDNKTMRVCST